jgi:Flp pilus assembly pilin Flp
MEDTIMRSHNRYRRHYDHFSLDPDRAFKRAVEFGVILLCCGVIVLGAGMVLKSAAHVAFTKIGDQLAAVR